MKICSRVTPKVSLSLLIAAGLAVPAQGQVAINEFLYSVSGPDDREFVELIGTPGASLDGIVLLVVDGDPINRGELDVAIDLTGAAFGSADPYYVMGSPDVSPDMDIGPLNNFENDDIVVYLVSIPDPTLRNEVTVDWLGTNILYMPLMFFNPPYTRLVTTPGIQILDSFGIGHSFDGALLVEQALQGNGFEVVGGVFRPGDCPSGHCRDLALDGDTPADPNDIFPDPTPGEPNPPAACIEAYTPATCDGSPSIGQIVCSTFADDFFSGIGPATIVASGSASVADNDLTLTAVNLVPNQFGFFLASRNIDDVDVTGAAGDLCLGGSIGRFVGPSQVQSSGAQGTFAITVDLAAIPQPGGAVPAMIGESWYFQSWIRDPDAPGINNNSRFTGAIRVEFN